MSSERSEALLRQRRAVVDFGRKALRSTDLQAVLTEACRLCGEALGTDLAKVLRLENEGRELLVIAGVGWDEGVVGHERVPAIPTSSEGYALRTGRPAISADISSEDRFDYAEFLKRHGVQAIVNVVIPGSDGRPAYGLLQVDSKTPREFTQDDIEFLQSYANIVGAAVERHAYQAELADALATKDLLLRELQHRVMNNLSLLTSLLRIRCGPDDHPLVAQNVADTIALIETLAELYRKLHASSQVSSVDLGGYLVSLGSGLASLHSRGGKRVEIETQTESIQVDADLAIPLGIIANEFVTNSLKHTQSDSCTITLATSLEEASSSSSCATTVRGWATRSSGLGTGARRAPVSA